MKNIFATAAIASVVSCTFAAPHSHAQGTLLARGTLTGSKAGSYRDLSGLNNTLENGVPANLLGGLGSGIAYLSGDTFLALPDRGPDAVSFNPLVDDTVTYIDRFHTVEMHLQQSGRNAFAFGFSDADLGRSQFVPQQLGWKFQR